MGRLTDRTVKTLDEGRHDDGDGLRLIVSKSGARSWMLRYQLQGRRRDMGLGAYPEISLKLAREIAADARKLIGQGIDPIEARKANRKAGRRVPTFKEVAALVVADAKARTSNAKVAYQWERHLGPAYCGPLLERPIHEITTTELAAHLRPIWKAKPEVARKLYPAIRRVFDRARVILKADHGIAMPENPASWADFKAQGFEAPKQLSRGHHPSLAYPKLPAFMSALREREATAASLLEFVILTNVRTDAALKAKWSEVDLDARLWTVPLDRLKDRKHRAEPFRVPLTSRAVEILEEMQKGRVSEFVFPGRSKKPLSNMAMLTLLKRMNSGDEAKWLDDATGRPIVVHGFRATFRTWAEETAQFPHAIVEEAMGHAVGTSVERAYRRTDVLERRRALMDAWANHCEPSTATNVVPLKKSGGAAV
jgi:integrase